MTSISRPVGRSSINFPNDVRIVQQLLNRFAPQHQRLLRVDGVVGHHTLHRLRAFQQQIGLTTPDEVVSPNGPTFARLLGRPSSHAQPATMPPERASASPRPRSSPTSAPAYSRSSQNSSGQVPAPNACTLKDIAWGARVSSGFKLKVTTMCWELQVAADLLMSCMAFETGETFSPSTRNAVGSGATGLIQFMPSTAAALGTTTDALAAMTAEQQLDYVKIYFAPYTGRLATIEDVYMAILYPAAIGQKPGFALFTNPSIAYRQNKGLDTNKDGKVTVDEAAVKIRAKLQKGLSPGYYG